MEMMVIILDEKRTEPEKSISQITPEVQPDIFRVHL